MDDIWHFLLRHGFKLAIITFGLVAHAMQKRSSKADELRGNPRPAEQWQTMTEQSGPQSVPQTPAPVAPPPSPWSNADPFEGRPKKGRR